MRGLLRDWRRWSSGERLTALVILAVSLGSVPASVLLHGLG
jgi:hypothetical protein